MHFATLARWLCLGILAVGLSGCVHPSKVDITSNKLDAYHPNIKRLLILTDIGAALKNRTGDDEAIFASAVTGSLDQCGIAAAVHKHDPLALNNDAQQAIRAFGPDTVMTIVMKSAQTINGIPVSSVLNATMIDLKTKTAVWKAEINYLTADNAGQALAAAIIARLKQETILAPACATPVVPKG